MTPTKDQIYLLLSRLAGVDTHEINLRDHPEAWSAVEEFASWTKGDAIACLREIAEACRDDFGGDALTMRMKGGEMLLFADDDSVGAGCDGNESKLTFGMITAGHWRCCHDHRRRPLVFGHSRMVRRRRIPTGTAAPGHHQQRGFPVTRDIKKIVKDCGGHIVTKDGVEVIEVRFDPAAFADFIERMRQLPPEGFRLSRIPAAKVGRRT